MKTALDVPGDGLDAGERDFISKVRRHGWMCTGVAEEDSKPAFSYSTGLWLAYGYPEVVIFGLRRDTSHQILWNIRNLVDSGQALPISSATDMLLEGGESYLIPVGKRNYPKYLGWSRWFYGGDDFPCLQFVWPDRAGFFPWNVGSDAGYRREQPDLSEHGWGAAITN